MLALIGGRPIFLEASFLVAATINPAGSVYLGRHFKARQQQAVPTFPLGKTRGGTCGWVGISCHDTQGTTSIPLCRLTQLLRRASAPVSRKGCARAPPSNVVVAGAQKKIAWVLWESSESPCVLRRRRGCKTNATGCVTRGKSIVIKRNGDLAFGEGVWKIEGPSSVISKLLLAIEGTFTRAWDPCRFHSDQFWIITLVSPWLGLSPCLHLPLFETWCLGLPLGTQQGAVLASLQSTQLPPTPGLGDSLNSHDQGTNPKCPWHFCPWLPKKRRALSQGYAAAVSPVDIFFPNPKRCAPRTMRRRGPLLESAFDPCCSGEREVTRNM